MGKIESYYDITQYYSMIPRDNSKLMEEKENLLINDFGQSSTFKQLAFFHRLSRLGTVVYYEGNTSLIIPAEDIPSPKRDARDPSLKSEPSLKKQSTTTVEEEINYNISPWVGWLIFFFSVFLSALGPSWMAWDIRSEPFTRNSWRFLVQTALLTPFFSFQKRTTPATSQKQLFKMQNLFIIFRNALQFVVFYFFFIISSKLTSINHAIHLSNTVIFWRLVIRFYEHYSGKKVTQIHEFEKAGAGMIIISFLLFFFDSLNNPVLENPESTILYLGRSRSIRFLGDLMALFTAYLLCYMQNNFKLIADLPTPPLQTSLVYNGFIALILSTFGYFCGGSEISFNPLYGMFGLFTIQNFVRIFYVSILLGLGFLVSNVFTQIIFPVTIISISGVIEPLVSSCLLHFFDSEAIPSGFTCIGFSFMVPGLLMIVAGRSTVLGAPMKFNFNLAVKKVEIL